MKLIKPFLVCTALILIFACNSGKKKETAKPIKRDLEEIKEDGKLKAITIYSGTSYFLYRGQPMGFEYELLERFANELGLELEIIIAKDINSLFNRLNRGDVDIIAHGLTITSARRNKVDFTKSFYHTHQVLVQKKPDQWRKMKLHEIQRYLVNDAIELIGDTVSVRKNSSYYQRLKNLSEEIGGRIIIDTLPGSLATDEIIKQVVDGKIKYTVADNNIAQINASYYPILDVSVPVSFSQRIGWAVRPNSPKLLQQANKWITQLKDKVDYYVIYNKYFKNERNFRRRIRSDFYSLNKNKISKYDDLIKKYSANLPWDWRLTASLVYQESRFDPDASSWAGAKGLMQLMAPTAKDLGVSNRTSPEQSIKGGTRYLNQIWQRFDQISDSTQRIKFTMAAYNCGYGHVIDAQKLAEKRDFDKDRWDNNVDQMILALSYPKSYNDPVVKYGYVKGIEPYTYVDQIFKRYEHYTKFISL
jgi:membrane-bound lytic murein transglycosylase F